MQTFPSRNTPEIGVDELAELAHSGSVHILDVREDWEYQRGRVPGAVNIPLGQLTARVGELARDKPYAVICEHGQRSLAGAEFLQSRGFEGVASVKGGTTAWARTERPLERG